ncbi:hypothetical protein LCGC14_2355170, partial [marine sediment metagenome]
KLLNINEIPIISETGAVIFVKPINKFSVPVKSGLFISISGLNILPNPIKIEPIIISDIFFLVENEFFKIMVKSIKGISETTRKIRISIKYCKPVNPKSKIIRKGIKPAK